jgi:hypothetical protein
MLRKQCDDGHDHARCAEAALECAAGEEGLLHGMKPVIGGKPLNGGDRLAVDREHEGGAGRNRLAVHEHRAGAADALVAADLAAGQSACLAQDVRQHVAGRDVELPGQSVERDRDDHA